MTLKASTNRVTTGPIGRAVTGCRTNIAKTNISWAVGANTIFERHHAAIGPNDNDQFCSRQCERHHLRSSENQNRDNYRWSQGERLSDGYRDTAISSRIGEAVISEAGARLPVESMSTINTCSCPATA